MHIQSSRERSYISSIAGTFSEASPLLAAVSFPTQSQLHPSDQGAILATLHLRPAPGRLFDTHHDRSKELDTAIPAAEPGTMKEVAHPPLLIELNVFLTIRSVRGSSTITMRIAMTPATTSMVADPSRSRVVPLSIPQQHTKDVVPTPSDTPNHTTHHTPNQTSNPTPNHTDDRTANHALNRTPHHTSNHMASRIPNRTRNRTPNRTQSPTVYTTATSPRELVARRIMSSLRLNRESQR